jgi:Ni,Fe-hydrogenase III component G
MVVRKNGVKVSSEAAIVHTKSDVVQATESLQPRIVRISELFSKKKCDDQLPLKKRTILAKKSRKKGAEYNNVTMEVSSFKMSNKSTVYGNKQKKIKSPSNVDILVYHNSRLQHFQELQESVPIKEKKLETLTDIIERSKLEREISDILGKKEENEYLFNTIDIIEEYSRVCNTKGESTSKKGLKKDTNWKITKFIDKYDNIEKEQLAEKYCKVVNNGMMINTKQLAFNNNNCEQCNGETTIIKGFFTCKDCGVVSENTIHDFQVSYKDLQDTMMKSSFSYKRINRFKEILSSLQAKENVDIPSCVINAINQEIEKEHDFDISLVDKKKIQYYLKRLSLTAYYDNIPHILNSINGINPIDIPIHVEEKLLQMFETIQDPFEIVKERLASSRLSFLNYHYTLHKLSELLSLDKLQKNFKLLKSIDKLRLHDSIWSGICEILGWEFIPSI